MCVLVCTELLFEQSEKRVERAGSTKPLHLLGWTRIKGSSVPQVDVVEGSWDAAVVPLTKVAGI